MYIVFDSKHNYLSHLQSFFFSFSNLLRMIYIIAMFNSLIFIIIIINLLYLLIVIAIFNLYNNKKVFKIFFEIVVRL